MGQFLCGRAVRIGVVYDEELAVSPGEQESFVVQLHSSHLRVVHL